MDSKDPQNDPDAITGQHELILSNYKAIIGDGPLVTSPKILGELPANPRGHRRTSVEEEVNIEIKAIILAVVLAGSQTKHVDVILTVGTPAQSRRPRRRLQCHRPSNTSSRISMML